MSLRDPATTNNERVLVTANASINALTTLTGMLWLFPTGLTNNGPLASKSNLVLNGWRFRNNGTTGNLEVQWDRVTTDLSYITNDVPMVTNKHTCRAFTIDRSASPIVHIYYGDFSTPMTEHAYGTSNDGSGTFADDSAMNFAWLNVSNFGATFACEIFYAMLSDDVLTLDEMRAWQFAPWTAPRGVVILHDFMSGELVVLDRKPYSTRNHGTVTDLKSGARVFPLSPRRRRFYWTPAFIQATTFPFVPPVLGTRSLRAKALNKQAGYYIFRSTPEITAEPPVEPDIFTSSVPGTRRLNTGRLRNGEMVYYFSSPKDGSAPVVVTVRINLPLTGAG